MKSVEKKVKLCYNQTKSIRHRRKIYDRQAMSEEYDSMIKILQEEKKSAGRKETEETGDPEEAEKPEEREKQETVGD